MQKEQGSFRDRSGFIFYDKDKIYRAVTNSYQQQYDTLFSSGLYEVLISHGFLVPHNDLSRDQWPASLSGKEFEIYKVLRPEKIPFISYPYEWCFHQLKDAAILTLEIQLKALEHNMTLKDASAYNIQFYKGKPVFIDTLSFDKYKEGSPWIAYRQFCSHFLAPLAIMKYVTTDLRRLSQLHIDGIPLLLASTLLPFKTKLRPFFFLHIHYHAKLETKYSADTNASQKLKPHLSRTKLLAVLNHLLSGIRSMELPHQKTEWGDYYNEFSYSEEAINNKKLLIHSWASQINPKTTWDLGCNAGLFSELVQVFSETVIAFDIDHLAIEKFYAAIKEKGYKNILPLVMDLSNPSSGIGWVNAERRSFVERGKTDLLLALALVHHLVIGNNVPLNKVAEFFKDLTQWLIIEFVPKDDKQVQRLLVTREDIFVDYSEDGFEAAFHEFFTIENKSKIIGTEECCT